MLDLVPAFRRQLGSYVSEDHTDSKLAAYIADATQALMYRWDREYTLVFTPPQTYVVTPDIADKDIRPLILMSSIIYKMGNIATVSFTDGDFSYNPHRGASSSLAIDRNELLLYIGVARLAKAVSAPLRGYAYVGNADSYAQFLAGGWITGGWF